MHELEIKYIVIHAMRLRDSVLMACVHVKHEVMYGYMKCDYTVSFECVVRCRKQTS